MEEKYIFVTSIAAIEIKKQLTSRNTPNAYLRLGVKGGGCSGFSYILQFEESIHDKDLVFESNGIQIVVDKKSITYLNQCVLDWEYTLLRQGFKFHNPQETSKCGCGLSFSVL